MWWRRLPSQPWFRLALLRQAIEEGEDSEGEQEVTDSEESSDNKSETESETESCEEEEECNEEEYWDGDKNTEESV